ncbi:MAG: extracellular solute-binding protein [Chloroflexi bacterium]|nr:extracellular solute-binding protein [Chloroflexota bacterium]
MKHAMTRRQVLKGVGALGGMAVLAACSAPAPSTATPTTVAPLSAADKAKTTGTFNFASYDEGESRQQATNTFFAKNYPNMTVKYDITPGLDPYFVKMQAQIAGNAPPDYMLMHETRALSFAAQGLLTNLDAYQNAQPMPLPPEQYLGAVERKYKGSFYVWPSGFGEYVLAYNKDVFDKAGVAYPDDNYTWQSMIDTAKQVSSKLPATFGFLGFDNLGTLNLWYPALKGYGGETFDETDTQCLLNTPEAIQTFDLIRDAYTSKTTPDPATVQTPNASRGIFFAGNGAMIYFLNGQFDLLQNNRQGNFKYGMLSLPSGPKGRFIRFGGSSYAVPKGSKFPQIGWELTQYLLNDEEAVKLYSGGLSSRADYFEKYSSPPPDAMAMLPNWHQASIEQGVQYRTFVRYSKIGSQFSPMVYSEAGALVDGSKTAAEVANSITDKANQMLKDFKA